MNTAKNSTVSIVRCPNYIEEEVDYAVDKLLQNIGGIENFVKPHNKVFLKVNLLAPTKPEEAVTTHPIVVKSLAKKIKAIGAEVWIGDSSGGMFSGLTSKALEITGMNKVAQETGAKIKNLDTIYYYICHPKKGGIEIVEK